VDRVYRQDGYPIGKDARVSEIVFHVRNDPPRLFDDIGGFARASLSLAHGCTPAAARSSATKSAMSRELARFWTQ
jgi:hypothetical protein